jgi:hypothetical protein
MLSSSVGIGTGWMTEESGIDSRQEQEIFLYTVQTPVQWVPWGCVPWCKEAGGVKLPTHLHLVPRFGIVEL